MSTLDDGKFGRARRDYAEPQLVNYGSIVDATGSFIGGDEGHQGDSGHEVGDH